MPFESTLLAKDSTLALFGLSAAFKERSFNSGKSEKSEKHMVPPFLGFFQEGALGAGLG